MRLRDSLIGGALLLACGPSSPVPTDSEGGTTSGTEGSASGSGDTIEDTTADDTSEPVPSETCIPAPPIDDTPPGADCSPGEPQGGGLCHEIIQLDLGGEFAGESSLVDLNDDGLLDIITVGSDSLTAYLGVQGAWPRLASTSMLVNYAGPAGAGDLDDDGHLDLVVGQSPLTLMYGSGDGGFSSRGGTPMPGPLVTALATDTDGDDLDDLVVLHEDGTISVLTARGEGRLSTAWVRSSGCEAPLAMAAGDFDDDGAIDLAVSSGEAGNITVLVGDGSGGFMRGVGIDAGATGAAMVARDFDLDGVPELAFIDTQASAVGLLDFTGGIPSVGASIATPEVARDLQTTDLQLDGHPDLVVGYAGARLLSYAWGRGDGTFEEAVTLEAPSNTNRVRVGDLDGDGYPDVLAADSQGTLGRSLGGPGGELGAMDIEFAHAGLLDMTIFDLDGDSFGDLLSATEDRYAVTPGGPGGELGAANLQSLPDAHDDLRFVLPARLNADSTPDVIFVGDSISTIPRLGDGGSLRSGSSTAPGTADFSGISVADFDEDGHDDFLMNSNFDLEVWHADGAGGLTQGAAVSPLSVLRNPHVAADVNGDGHQDALWAPPIAGSIEVSLGDGNGGFGLVISSPITMEVSGLAVGDLDEDGWLDVVTATFSDEVLVAWGQGDGSFAGPQVVFEESHSRPMVADFNGDGHLDVAAYDWQSQAVAVRVGDGDGAFEVGESFSTSFLDIFPVAGDLNGDGLADAVLRGEESRLRVLMSNPCGCG